ncbi:MAG: hypothetical protein ISS77_02360 [Phycisphaerae bacterium]|nr:hypothetical protein [Phycisphaerae bacterium]
MTQETKNNVAALGSSDFVMPFAALGLDTFAVSGDEQEIIKNAQDILEKKYVLIVVAENVAKIADQVFVQRAKNATPCVIVVPFTTESQGYATQSLGQALKLATGINILQNN